MLLDCRQYEDACSEFLFFVVCLESVPPPEGAYLDTGLTTFLYSRSKIFVSVHSKNAGKRDYKCLFPTWQILMIARYGEFVTRSVKTELAITSATVQRGMSWSTSGIAKLILPVSKLRTLAISPNRKLRTDILLPQQMTKEMPAFMWIAGFYHHKLGVDPAARITGPH